MAAYGINAGDVATAVAGQNLDLPAGQIGQPPAAGGPAVRIAHRHAGPAVRSGAIRRDHRQGRSRDSAPRRPRRAGAGRRSVPACPAPGIDQSARERRLDEPGGSIPTALGTAVQSPVAHVGSRRAIRRPRPTRPAAHRYWRRRRARRRRRHRRRHDRRRPRPAAAATTGGSAARARRSLPRPSAPARRGEIAGLSINSQSTASARPTASWPGTTLARRRAPRRSASSGSATSAGSRSAPQNYQQAMTFDGHPSVGLAVFQLPGTNALDVAERVESKDEGTSKPISRRRRIQDRLRHHAVHPRVGPGRVQDPVGGGGPGRPGGAGLPAELASGADPA